MIRRNYLQGESGQIHYRELIPELESAAPLVCLHPAPFSGLFFTNAMPLLGDKRRVIAPDYPGYGGSDIAESEPTIADYARHMRQLLQQICPDQPVYLLGFHTGCLVAAEMALQNLEAVAGLVLIDVPFFVGDAQTAMLQRAAAPMTLCADEDSIAQHWKSGVVAKIDAMGLQHAVPLFAEQLRAYPYTHYAFRAAFTYSCEERFSHLDLPTKVIASKSGLRDATLACAACVPNAELEEANDITRAVFEEGAAKIAVRINRTLTGFQEHNRE